VDAEVAVEEAAAAAALARLPEPPTQPLTKRFLDSRRFRERFLFHDPTPLYFHSKRTRPTPTQRDAWSSEVGPPTGMNVDAIAASQPAPPALRQMLDDDILAPLGRMGGSTASAIGSVYPATARAAIHYGPPAGTAHHLQPHPPPLAQTAPMSVAQESSGYAYRPADEMGISLPLGMSGSALSPRVRPRPPEAYLPKSLRAPALGVPLSDLEVAQADHAWKYARADVEREFHFRDSQAQSYMAAAQAHASAVASADTRAAADQAQRSFSADPVRLGSGAEARRPRLGQRTRPLRPHPTLSTAPVPQSLLPDIHQKRLPPANFRAGASIHAMRPPSLTRELGAMASSFYGV